MGRKKMSLGIVDEFHKSWNINKKIVAFYFVAMITTLSLTYGILIEYPLMSENLFWTIVRIIFLTYVISAFGLLVKAHGVISDVVITKLRDDSIRTRDLAESCLQWAASKPDKVQDVIDAFLNNDIWISSNSTVDLLERINNLEKENTKLNKLIKKKQKKGKIEVEVPIPV